MCPANLAITELNLCFHILFLSLPSQKKKREYNSSIALHCHPGGFVKNNEITQRTGTAAR